LIEFVLQALIEAPKKMKVNKKVIFAKKFSLIPMLKNFYTGKLKFLKIQGINSKLSVSFFFLNEYPLKKLDFYRFSYLQLKVQEFLKLPSAGLNFKKCFFFPILSCNFQRLL